MARTIRCSIVTPSGAVFDGPVTYASLPAWDGQTGIMVGTSPLLTRLDTGHLRLDAAEGGPQWYLVDGGFAQVHDDVITLLTEQATQVGALSREEAEAELAEANARVTRPGEDQRRVEADQKRARMKLALLDKVRPRSA